MAEEMKVPKTGYDETEATLVEWLKEEGDAVEYEDDIVVLEPNHRGDMEPTSPQLNELVPRFFGLRDKQAFIDGFEALLRQHNA